MITTLVHPRNRRESKRHVLWEAPPGWHSRESDGETSAVDPETACPALRPGIILRELHGSLVIHDPLTRDIHKLNLSAATILLLANGERSQREIAELHSHRFEISLWKAIEETRTAIDELIEKGLVIMRPAKTSS